MTPPETRYARSGDIRIAYQVVGNGPFDLVYVPGYVSNMDLYWDGPAWSHFFSRLAAFSRLILFDKRGTGLSDRMAGVATLEERMDDVRAVMDAAHSFGASAKPSEDTGKVAGAFRIGLLQYLSHGEMQALAILPQQRFIDCILYQRVPEDVLQFRLKLRHTH